MTPHPLDPRSRPARVCALRALLASRWPPPRLPRWADIHIGVTLSTTGPGASLGIPAEQALKMWPAEMAGEKVRFTILNDTTDTTTAAKNAQRLISEDKVDLIIGSSVTPTSLAVVETAGAAQVPVISLAGGGAIVLPQDGPRRWAFKLSPTEPISIALVLDHMLKNEGQVDRDASASPPATAKASSRRVEAAAPASGIKIVASERYNPTDASVTAQVLKIVAANPDAVYIFAAGTPGALPQIELASAATRASSTRPRASPTTTSCASAARTSKAAT